MKRTLTSMFFLFLTIGLMAQSFDAKVVAKDFLQENIEKLDLTSDDIANYTITDMYQTKHNGVTHVYLTQTHGDIQVYNAILNLNITADGKVPFYGNRFVKDLKEKIESTSFSIKPEQAIESVAQELKIEVKAPIRLKEQLSKNAFVFEKTSFSDSDLKVEKKYYLTKSGTVVPTWDVTLEVKGNADYWNTRVHAVTGEVVHKHNYTVYCTHKKGAYDKVHLATCNKAHAHTHAPHATDGDAAQESSALALMDAQYKVYPLPAESPSHGSHEIITEPIVGGSPFGWHDANGIEGADFTITRGNNVHAYADRNGNDSSVGDEPDGGSELIFDFSVDENLEPEDNQDALITNLFYMNNMMHDITYLLGFDEAAGNFQSNNYGNGGTDGDYVVAEGLDGSGIDNANFATPADGTSGRMQMFLWNQTPDLFNVVLPTQLEGGYDFGAIGTGWSYADYNAFDVEGEIAIAFDGNPQGATQCCDDIVNDSEIAGKIALIDRGGCEFGSKAFNAQNNGAIACIICNIPGADSPESDGNTPVGMLGGSDGLSVTIPTIMLGKIDCDRFRASINAGTPVVASIKIPEVTGPGFRPGSLDNGIIAHEYGHGISNRLTGGPSASGCLGNDEQMGEGWSDLFTLFYSVEPGDSGTDARGIGTYALGENTTGRGIRSFPYSTDMSVNPETYDDIKGTTAPHPLGAVWVTACWDMYWAMVDKYGYDADWTNTESGNFKAVQLVVDGMKFQPCSPGFIDGRNAILGADLVNNNGENECLIWDAFARRGIGVDADQGSTADRNDGVEGFEPLATCIQELKIDKTASAFISPGGEIEVDLLIRNHTLETKNGVTVTDELPGNSTYIDGSATIAPEVNGNILTWNLGTMESLDETSISYKILTDVTEKSTSLYFNSMENGVDDFTVDIASGANLWFLSGLDARSGSFSWEIDDTYEAPANFNGGGDTRLVIPGLDVMGTNPALRFWHKYNTESGIDGGFIEISTDGGVTYQSVTEKMFRNGYNAIINYSTLAIPSLNGFTGMNNTDWIDTYIDLNDYIGETITVRFRFGTDGVNTTFAPAWFIDDIEMLDVLQFTSEACVTSDEGDNACVATTTLIDAEIFDSAEDILLAENIDMNIYPNPAGDYTSIQLQSTETYDAQVSVLTMDGKLMYNQAVSLRNGIEILNINTMEYAKGFYIVRLESGNGVMTQKLIIQ